MTPSSDAEHVRRMLAEARSALQRGDAERAEALCRRALAAGDDAGGWTLLGTALRRRDAAAAEQALRRALALDGGNVDAAFHLGNLLRESGRNAQAIGAYRQALVRAPRHPSLLNNLALALAADGEHSEAERAYEAALAVQPEHAQALVNLVHLLCGRRRCARALQLAERYLRAHAEAPAELWIDCGICWHHERHYDRAAACFHRALAIAPADAVALANLASVLIEQGDFVAAEPLLARAQEASPRDVYTASLLAYSRQHLCQWQGLEALQGRVVDALAGDAAGAIEPFVTLSMPMSPALQQQVARKWASGIEAACTFAPAAIRHRGNKLRLGYVSSDFRVHALAFLATEVWERHDRTRFQTFAYAIGPPDRSALRARIDAAFDTFRDCHADDAARVAMRIRDDGIDLLIDLNGYTTHSRSEIFAARPAPVQMQWLGYLGTMGAGWIDYVVTDRYVTPPCAQAHFDERFLYLPDCYCPSDTRREVAPLPDRAACGLPARAFVLCCFNNPYKLQPTVFDAWMRLLRDVPEAVLWLSPSSSAAMANLQREAAVRAVQPSRLVFAPRVAPDVHLARHAQADLYLDTSPYNAGTAANDALFMGVPVLTCSGETMASRVAGSQLHALGMSSLVATNLADYETRARTIASERTLAAALKAEIAAKRRSAPLFDMARFTHAFEEALQGAAGKATT